MKKYIINISMAGIMLITCLSSCSNYLEVKSDKKLVVPASVEDAQALFNDTYTFTSSYSGTAEIASGDFYLLDKDWQSINSPTNRNSYIWGDDIFNESDLNDWSQGYITVYACNVILDALYDGRINDGTLRERERVEGTGLFFRSYAFYNLLQLFSKGWNAGSAAADPGIALRLKSDVNEPTRRSSVKECYDQIIYDLNRAAELLPEITGSKNMPSKQIAHAFLARVYLSMGNYQDALIYAEKATPTMGGLLDFNDVESANAFPFLNKGEEILFFTLMLTPAIMQPPTLKVDTALQASYSDSDLRKKLFFRLNPDGTYSFKGSYNGNAILFNGLTTSELYLIVAECYAREGNYTKAMNKLNELLMKRIKKDEFVPLTADSAQESLRIILNERRKELAFRGLRWADLKRLNQEEAFEVTLERKIGESLYQLPPNDNRYAFPIPRNVVELTGIEQNIR